MIELREHFWAYPMPNAEGAEIRGEHPGRPYQLLSFYGEADAVDLPPGTWEIVCTSKEVTEQIASQIVEKDGDVFYKCYAGKRSHISLRSLFCLMDERGCDLNNNYLILKKS
jgi:hypothetical protein